MKKLLVPLVVMITAIIIGGSSSFYISKNNASEIASKSDASLTPLDGQLILFQNDKFSPCWVFRWEYSDKMTGATFDVYTTLMGNVFKSP